MSRAAFGSTRVVLAALLGAALGCSDPEQQVVARESPAPVADGGHPALSKPRGRVRVVDGKLVTDIGTPLRGVMAPVDVGWKLHDFELLASLAETTGLNAIHVYLENYSQEAGEMQAEAGELVSLAAQAGLYVVLGIGGGPDAEDHPGNGWFDPAKVASFWSLYADRFKDSPHVLFEIQNNPELSCSDPLSAATIDLERETYEQIRTLAPDSHVVLFSFSSPPRPAVLGDAIARVSDVVDWSNASVAFHENSDCLALDEFPALREIAASSGVALLSSQLSPTDWAPALSVFERDGVGWLHHQWLAFDQDLDAFREQTLQAELTWCPDQGTFPEDSSACRDR